ncbi:MAG: Forkhead box protein P4 [Paramarteilia canceri]
MPRNSPFEKEYNFHARRDTKPACTYAQMIRKAIESSPSGSRTLSEIYNWMQMNYSYFANSPNSNWKNAVRHNLSLYAYFVRHRSPHGGSLWSIDSGLAEKHQQKSSQTPIATKAKSENKFLSPEQNSNLSNDGEISIAGKDSSANGEISSTESIDSKSNDDENSEESEEIHKKIDLPTPKDCQQNSIPKNENIKNQNRKQHVTT